MDAKLKLSFDADCNVRVLDAEKYKGSEELKVECEKFNEKIDKFTELSHGIIEVIDKKAEQIETLKLRAIGQRNQVEHEQDTRNRKKKELMTIIGDMKQALERCVLCACRACHTHAARGRACRAACVRVPEPPSYVEAGASRHFSNRLSSLPHPHLRTGRVVVLCGSVCAGKLETK